MTEYHATVAMHQYSSAPVVLCCDWFHCGSRQVKPDPVDLVTVGYNITLAGEYEILSLCLSWSFQLSLVVLVQDKFRWGNSKYSANV